jgi:hypothetical protein
VVGTCDEVEERGFREHRCWSRSASAVFRVHSMHAIRRKERPVYGRLGELGLIVGGVFVQRCIGRLVTVASGVVVAVLLLAYG